MIPRSQSQQYQWYCGVNLRSINDTAESNGILKLKSSAVSLSPRSLTPRTQWFRRARLRGLNDTPEIDSAVSIYRTVFSKFDYLREFETIFNIILAYESEAWVESINEKKQRSKISWHCPFNREGRGEVWTLLYNISETKREHMKWNSFRAKPFQSQTVTKPYCFQANLFQSQTVTKPNCFEAKLFQSKIVSKPNCFKAKFYL